MTMAVGSFGVQHFNQLPLLLGLQVWLVLDDNDFMLPHSIPYLIDLVLCEPLAMRVIFDSEVNASKYARETLFKSIPVNNAPNYASI